MLVLDTGASDFAPASANAPHLVRRESLLDVRTEGRPLFDLRAHPHAELQDQLKLLGKIVPPIVIACPVSREVIVSHMLTARTVRQYVISGPGSSNVAAANVALAARLTKNLDSLGSSEAIRSRSSVRILTALTQTAQFNHSTSQVGPIQLVWPLHFVPRVSSAPLTEL